MDKKQFLLLVFLLFSTLASAEWHRQELNGVNPNHLVSSIAVVDENVVWAVLDTLCMASPAPNFTPKVILTTDGGKTWVARTVTGVKNTYIVDICAIDANTAWVNTNDLANKITSYRIYRTTDGGKFWAKQSNSRATFLHFFDATNGVKISGYGAATTIDGGNHWKPVPGSNIPPRLSEEFILTYSGNNGFACCGDCIWFGTSKGRIYRSTDRGYHWTVSKSSLGEFAVINSLAFKDENNGLAVSALKNYFKLQSQVVRTTDGGLTWTQVNAPATVTPSSIAYVPGTTGTYMVVSPVNTLGTPANIDEHPGSAFTLDNGATWEVVDNIQYNAISFATSHIGWAGSISTTTHCGMFKWEGKVAVEQQNIGPNILPGFRLSQNYPNPFNPGTVISYQLPALSTVRLKVYNNLGHHISTIVNERQPAGIHEINFDASKLAGGIYFYRLEAENFAETKKMILVK